MGDGEQQIIPFVILTGIIILMLHKLIVAPRQIKQRLGELEKASPIDEEAQREIMSLNAAQEMQKSRNDAHLVIIIALAIVFPIFMLIMHYISTHP